jgi:hypothetical protein
MSIAVYNAPSMNWLSAFLVGPVVAVFLFFWLLSNKNIGKAQITLGSLTTSPLWPIDHHLVQAWLFIALCLIAGGISRVLIELVSDTGLSELGGMFVILGISVALATLLAWRIRRSSFATDFTKRKLHQKDDTPQ